MKNRLPLLLGLFFLNACSTGNLEGMMDEYCTCIERANNKNSDKIKCIELLSKVQEKYGFDPESSEYVIKRMKECTRN